MLLLDNIEKVQTETTEVIKSLNKWTVEDVSKWLDEIGLEQYKSSFEQNAIDGTELEVITDSMLQQIGVGKVHSTELSLSAGHVCLLYSSTDNIRSMI